MKFTLLVVGRTVEKHYITAINDYVERTYWGKKYHGGYSDHLPVCVDFEIGK